jgi:hypothetical protein
MSERPTCPIRGAELPHGAPRNLCPRCLSRAGLGGDSQSLARNGGPDATAARQRPRLDCRHDRTCAARPAPRHRTGRGAIADRPATGSGWCRSLDPLQDRWRDRPRRHGRRAQGPRPRPGPRRRPQGAPRRPPRQYRHGPPLRRGGADRRPVAAPRHRADLRAGHVRRPPAVLLHEAGQGAHAGRLAGRQGGPRPTACHAFCPSSRRSPRPSPTPTPAA